MHLYEAYEQMGGEIVLRFLVDRFYDLMDYVADYFGIRKLHPMGLSSSRQNLFMFLSGWIGGPSLYTKKYGEPRLRSRHLPFSIGVVGRDQWLSCMESCNVADWIRRAVTYKPGESICANSRFYAKSAGIGKQTRFS